MVGARVLCFSAVLTFGVSFAVLAQETTTTTTKPESHAVMATIDTAQVVYVSGDDAVVKLPDGSLRLLEVPAGTSFTVDGRPAKVSDLRPGSVISHARVSSRTESNVTTVTQINGTVTAKNGPFVTLRMDDGTSKIYKVPANATFTIDGQSSTYGSLRTGSKVSATAVKTEGLSTVNGGSAMAAQTPPQIGILLIERR
jgi:Cu/Ag efflux protein CusF